MLPRRNSLSMRSRCDTMSLHCTNCPECIAMFSMNPTGIDQLLRQWISQNNRMHAFAMHVSTL